MDEVIEALSYSFNKFLPSIDTPEGYMPMHDEYFFEENFNLPNDRVITVILNYDFKSPDAVTVTTKSITESWSIQFRLPVTYVKEFVNTNDVNQLGIKRNLKISLISKLTNTAHNFFNIDIAEQRIELQEHTFNEIFDFVKQPLSNPHIYELGKDFKMIIDMTPLNLQFTFWERDGVGFGFVTDGIRPFMQQNDLQEILMTICKNLAEMIDNLELQSH